MKELFKNLGKFILDVLKEVDYKTVLYKGYKTAAQPLLEKLAKDSTSKIDDIIVAGLNQLVEKFLAPVPQIEAPKA